MNSFQLKVFAISVMLIDHIGAIIISATGYNDLNFACRLIGRMAFPVFAFLIVEGFHHTSNAIRYMKRLLAFAFLSEIPFDLAFYQVRFNTDPISDIRYMFEDPSYSNVVLSRFNDDQNIFFTLFLGLLLIYLFDLVEKKFNKPDFMNIVISNSLDGFLTVAFCAAAYLLKTDYDLAGILVIVAFYLFRESKLIAAISIFIIMSSRFCNYTQFARTGNWWHILSAFAVLAIIPILFYNGKKGKSIKYFFYAFYPVHLVCLFLIAYLFKLQ